MGEDAFLLDAVAGTGWTQDELGPVAQRFAGRRPGCRQNRKTQQGSLKQASKDASHGHRTPTFAV
jgi:hypothetical protein